MDFPASQLTASLRLSKSAEHAGCRVEIWPDKAWRGSPYVGWYPVLLAASLIVRRVRRITAWRVQGGRLQGVDMAATLLDEVVPSREAAERVAVDWLKEATGDR